VGGLIRAFRKDSIRAGVFFVEAQRLDETGEQDHSGAGVGRADVLDELDAVHTGHAEIRHHEIELSDFEEFEAFIPVMRQLHGATGLLKESAADQETVAIVINKEDVWVGRRSKFHFGTDASVTKL
jgi:hypothetical protein